VLPIMAAQLPVEIPAGITLAAIAIPEVMGYTKHPEVQASWYSSQPPRSLTLATAGLAGRQRAATVACDGGRLEVQCRQVERAQPCASLASI